jgi:hypothetical protein
MNRESATTFYKISVALIGGACFALALANIKPEVTTWKFFTLLLFTVLIAPRMSIALPRSKFILSFSDSMVFLSFLLFGGEAAIIVATAEIFANCLFLKFKGVEFPRYTIVFGFRVHLLRAQNRHDAVAGVEKGSLFVFGRLFCGCRTGGHFL